MRDRVLNIIHRGVEVANRLRHIASQTPEPDARVAVSQAAAWLEMGLRDCNTAVRLMELEGFDYLRYQMPHYIPAEPHRHWLYPVGGGAHPHAPMRH